MNDERFDHSVEPLLSFTAQCQRPWCRIATNEAKAPGTYVHIGYKGDHESALSYETAAELHEWLGRALRLSDSNGDTNK